MPLFLPTFGDCPPSMKTFHRNVSTKKWNSIALHLITRTMPSYVETSQWDISVFKKGAREETCRTALQKNPRSRLLWKTRKDLQFQHGVHFCFNTVPQNKPMGSWKLPHVVHNPKHNVIGFGHCRRQCGIHGSPAKKPSCFISWASPPIFQISLAGRAHSTTWSFPTFSFGSLS